MAIDKEELKQFISSIGAVHLAERLGVTFLRDGPRKAKILCPWHNERNPSCSVWIGDNGHLQANCYSCGGTGDGIELVAKVKGFEGLPFSQKVGRCAEVLGMVPSREFVATDRRHASSPPPVEAKRNYPPEVEVASIWRHSDGDVGICRPVMKACADLPEEMFGVLTESYAKEAKAPCWPYGGSYLMLKAYDAQGEWRSVHGRNLHPDASPKCRWPYGVSSKGLFFADEPGLKFLRGRPEDAFSAVFIAEGLTDTASAAAWSARRRADGRPILPELDGWDVCVLGIGSNSADCIGEIEWPDKGIRVYVAVDNDSAGSSYLEKIKEALPPRVRGTARRVIIEKLERDEHGGAISNGRRKEAN